MDLTENTIIEVMRRLLGGNGPGGMYTVSSQRCILRFGQAIGHLGLIVTNVSEWLENERPPRDAYHLLMSGRTIGLDKNPRVRQTEVEETCLSLISKCILMVTIQESKETCGTISCFGDGSWYRGWHSCNAPPVVSA